MRTVLVRYKTHENRAAENESLIRAVFDELKTNRVSGVRYQTFKLADGVSFVHYATLDMANGVNPLTSLDSFKAFQRDIKERCVEQPVSEVLTPIDEY